MITQSYCELGGEFLNPDTGKERRKSKCVI